MTKPTDSPTSNIQWELFLRPDGSIDMRALTLHWLPSDKWVQHKRDNAVRLAEAVESIHPITDRQIAAVVLAMVSFAAHHNTW